MFCGTARPAEYLYQSCACRLAPGRPLAALQSFLRPAPPARGRRSRPQLAEGRGAVFL